MPHNGSVFSASFEQGQVMDYSEPPLTKRLTTACCAMLATVALTGCISPVSAKKAAAKWERDGKEVVHNEPRLSIPAGRKWNPTWWCGNADDPLPPDWYKPDDPARERKWQLRNPLHNFTFYVVGVADKPFDRVGRRPRDVFNPQGGWNWATCAHKHWRFPFISYTRGRFAMYWGWRERGNFGVKLTFRRQVTPAAKRDEPNDAAGETPEIPPQD